MLSLTVACPSCKPVCQYSWETSSLQEELGYGELWHRVSSGVQTETRKILSLAVPWFLCPYVPGLAPLGPGIWAKVLVLPVLTHVLALLGDQLFPSGFGHGKQWHRVSSRHRRKLEGSCPRLLLGSCVLSALGNSLGAEVVVLPVLTGVPVLPEDQLSLGSIWVWNTVAQDQLWVQT